MIYLIQLFMAPTTEERV